MKKRDSGLDLLRILSMVMVTTFHFFNHGGLVNGTLITGHYNWYLGQMVYALCYVCVNCFVMLSGYFHCTSKFKLRRIVSIWVQVMIYSVGLYIVNALYLGSFSVTDLIISGMVVTMKRYWFVTAYLLMYAISPFLNTAIAAMGKRKHFACLCVLLSIFCVAHNAVYISDFGNVLGGSSFLWFCVLYMVASYIRLYVPVNPKHRGRYLTTYLLLSLCICGERFLATWLTPYVFGSVKLDSLFFSYNSICTAGASIGLFLLMRTVEIKSRPITKIISFLAPLCFGVYLLHDHHSIRPLLWGWMKPFATATAPYMLLHWIMCVGVIFLAGIGVEWLRKQLFRLLRIDKLVDFLSDKVESLCQGWLDKLPTKESPKG